MIKKLLKNIKEQKKSQRDAELYRNLMRHEAKIGGQLFGNLPAGGRREFFCLDTNTWVWHEEWLDDSGQRQIRTTRYDVRPNQIIKSFGGRYQEVTFDEAEHLMNAVRLYKDRVMSELYSFAL